MDNSSEFTEYKTSNEEKNSVWKYFLRSADAIRAKCKICNKILKNSRSTTPLHSHLKLHSINLKQRSENESASSSNTPAIASSSQMASTSESTRHEPPTKKTKLTDYFKSDDTMEVCVSKLAALDGLSFHVICTSTTLRKLFTKSGYKLPKSPHTIKKIVVTHGEQIKSSLKQELARIKSDKCSFSASLDEWTSSSQNVRYLNINLHSPRLTPNGFKNLGLMKIKNKGTAQNFHNMLAEKLNEFDLASNDIICIITDAASVMCALGRRTTAFQQLCYAHGIQLAVLDVIYKKGAPAAALAAETASDLDIETDSDFEYEGIEEIEHEEGLYIAQSRPTPLQLADDYKNLVNKVRSVVKLFKKSPIKSDLLYKNSAENKKDIHLILDCKTRWSSLADMITRFNLLKEAVLKSLIDLKSPITISEEELQQLEEVADSLNIIKTTVEAICQRDANLLTAEIAMKFMVQKLNEKQTLLSMNLVNALKERIAQRRLTEVTGTLKYLHNPTNFYKEGLSEYPFENPTNDRIKDVILKLNSSHTEHENVELQSLDVDTTAVPSTSTTMKDQLQDEIKKGLSTGISNTATGTQSGDLDMETQVNVEMALFDSGGKRPDHLERAYNALLTIPPSSVEAERVFSAAGYLCNHLRSRMKQDSLNALCFLRSHYQAELNKE